MPKKEVKSVKAKPRTASSSCRKKSMRSSQKKQSLLKGFGKLQKNNTVDDAPQFDNFLMDIPSSNMDSDIEAFFRNNPYMNEQIDMKEVNIQESQINNNQVLNQNFNSERVLIDNTENELILQNNISLLQECNQNQRSFSFKYNIIQSNQEFKMALLWQKKADMFALMHDHDHRFISVYQKCFNDFAKCPQRSFMLHYVVSQYLQSKNVPNNVTRVLKNILEKCLNQQYNQTFALLQNAGFFGQFLANRIIRYQIQFFSFKKMLKNKQRKVLPNQFCMFCLVHSKVLFIEESDQKDIQIWRKRVNMIQQYMDDWQKQKISMFEISNFLREKFSFVKQHKFSKKYELNLYDTNKSQRTSFLMIQQRQKQKKKLLKQQKNSKVKDDFKLNSQKRRQQYLKQFQTEINYN